MHKMEGLGGAVYTVNRASFANFFSIIDRFQKRLIEYLGGGPRLWAIPKIACMFSKPYEVWFFYLSMPVDKYDKKIFWDFWKRNI